ncbi:uncharacterized protein LOC110461272 [Mizuhopecten yessoensis]|uniref:uncharacterized protein LOC110461272 n=1 Tax=Mizuhopecten yessoensis TaxID=6573 RepID=UPI000B45F75C|nr:uncharacterized protein LOC110461272 [Mizuhopecten yessoensis]
MADHSEQYEKSWILHHILDRFIGSPELVETRRRRDSSFPQDSKDKTVFMMRNADCRPGYVTLELVNLVPTCIELIKRSVVPVRDVFYISSEMFRRECADALCDRLDSIVETHGPAACLKTEHCDIIVDGDIVHSFPCTRWPQEAYEWVSRPRQHGWPDKALRDQIVSGGCHLVPVGDKMSDATFLQWRLSFTTAERKLINSLTHTQFLIYGLLKYFLKQISDRLKQIFGDENILSSYIIKTIIFHVVESTPGSVWQEKNTFFCFMLCLKVLIAWVNAGYCPNHFININNMFRGKVQGENPQKLLRLLIDLDDMKWDCLSVGTVIEPSFGILLQSVRNGAWQLVLRPPTESELKCDMEIFSAAFVTDILPDVLAVSLSLLSVSNFGSDEFIAYITTDSCIPQDTKDKTVFMMRDADSRPGWPRETNEWMYGMGSVEEDVSVVSGGDQSKTMSVWSVEWSVKVDVSVHSKGDQKRKMSVWSVEWSVKVDVSVHSKGDQKRKMSVWSMECSVEVYVSVVSGGDHSKRISVWSVQWSVKVDVSVHSKGDQKRKMSVWSMEWSVEVEMYGMGSVEEDDSVVNGMFSRSICQCGQWW